MIRTIETMARENLWRLELREEPLREIVEASIDCRNWTLCFRLDPKASQTLEAMSISGAGQRLLVQGLVQHEVGHWEICPFDSEGQYLMLESISTVVRQKRRKAEPQEIGKLVCHLANIVSDLIVDTVQAWEASSSAYADAQALFFVKELQRNQNLSPLDQVYVALHLALWGERTSYADRCRVEYSSDLLADRVQKALSLFKHREQSHRLAGWLRDHSNWPFLAGKLASLLLDLVESSNIPHSRPSPFQDVLTVLYQGRAASIELALEGSVAELAGIPVSPLFTRAVDPLAMPPVERLVWPQTQCTVSNRERPRLQLFQSEVDLEVPIYPVAGRSFLPDLAFLVDSSGSMDYDPYAGKGEYDLVLCTIFGVFHWLVQQGMASFLRYAALNFSTETLYSGWCGWDERTSFHETLFRYQGGETRLDIAIATRMVQESQRAFTAILISDGEIENSAAVAGYVKRHFTPPTGFVMVQMGWMSRLARTLLQQGYEVHLVRNHGQLKDAVLGQVRQRYSS